MDVQALRLMNLFGLPMAQPGLDTYSQSQPDNTQAPDINAQLLNSYQPRSDISNQLTSTLTNLPQRPQPGNLRNVAAAIAGMGAGASPSGIAGGQPIGFHFDPRMADIASDKVKYGDFDNQLNDWQNKVKALTVGANEEDRANFNQAKEFAANQANDIKQQQVGVNRDKVKQLREKSDQIYQTKEKEHQDRIAKLNAEVKKWGDEIRLKGKSIDNLEKYQTALSQWHQAVNNRQRDQFEYQMEQQQTQFDEKMYELEHRPEKTGSGDYTSVTELLDAQGNPTSDQSKAVSKRTRRVRGSDATGGRNIISDPDGNKYDTSTWSAADKAAAAAKGWR